MHEMTHSLGFSRSKLASFRDSNGIIIPLNQTLISTTTNDKSVLKIISPTVRSVVRNLLVIKFNIKKRHETTSIVQHSMELNWRTKEEMEQLAPIGKKES